MSAGYSRRRGLTLGRKARNLLTLHGLRAIVTTEGNTGWGNQKHYKIIRNSDGQSLGLKDQHTTLAQWNEFVRTYDNQRRE